MVSTGKFQLLSTLHEDCIERFEPTISDNGQVEYTEAKGLLNRRDGTSMEALNSLAEKGLLHKEYTSKVYICPSCQVEGMQYITACPSCESTHTVRTSFFEHAECDYTAESTEFEPENSTDEYQCPDCGNEFDSSNLNIKQKYVCKGCNKSFESPSHRLWCLNCLYLCSPKKATEQTLYEYELSEDGKNWYEVQTTARELLVDELNARGFDIRINTDVQNDGNEPYSVHIHAEDDLLNKQIVADIHSAVNSDKLQFISTVAGEINAQPLLLVTDESIPNDMLQVANQHGVIILWIDSDGSIRRYESVDGEHHSSSNIIDKLSSSVGLTSWK